MRASLLLIVTVLSSLLLSASLASGSPDAPRHVSRASTPLVKDGVTCAYTRNNLAELKRFEQRTGRTYNCIELYNDAAPIWKGWTTPWFLHHGNPDFKWPKWIAGAPAQRRVIIAQSMVPGRPPADWRARGARGDYDVHARRLARNLVASGMGSAIIRLGHEMNGTWYVDNVGATAAQHRQWRLYWRRIVKAMDSVKGGHFLFDFNIAAGYREIAFSDYWPGDDVVDIFGIDFYDYGYPGVPAAAGASRWQMQIAQRGGVEAAIAFAKAHGKPVSFPEWGLAVGGPKGGIGDDPAFVQRMAQLMNGLPLAYHAYFECPNGDTLPLASAPRSLAAFRRAFAGPGASAAVLGW